MKTLAKSLLAFAAGAAGLGLSACDPTPAEEAARDNAPRAAGTPPGNLQVPVTPIETSSPEIANTAEASRIETKADAAGTPQSRAPGSVQGEGAPDTSGRAHQERPSER